MGNGLNNSDIHFDYSSPTSRHLEFLEGVLTRTTVALSVFSRSSSANPTVSTRFPRDPQYLQSARNSPYTHNLSEEEILQIAHLVPASAVAVFDPCDDAHFGTSSAHLLLRATILASPDKPVPLLTPESPDIIDMSGATSV